MDYAAHILIVDDNPDIREVVRVLLEDEGYTTAEAANGKDAVRYVTEHAETDLIILDIMMRGMSGTEACTQIRKISTAPILFLTAKSQETDKVIAYSSGGDDYVVKPFSRSELIMKIHSLLRRYFVYKGKDAYPSAQSEVELSDGILIDCVNRLIKKDGVKIEMTEKESAIMAFFLDHRGKVVDTKTIYEGVWKEKYFPASANTVMVHILNLRKKIEDDPNNPRFIRTVWGRGYEVD